MPDTATKSERYVDRRLRELDTDTPEPPLSPSRGRHYGRNYCRAWRATEVGARSHHESMVKAKYGITLDAYDAMLTAQGHRCAICGVAIVSAYSHVIEFGLARRGAKRGSAMIDHDHVTGLIRGLLCVRCNMGIGCFRDSAAGLEAAARYLREHGHS